MAVKKEELIVPVTDAKISDILVKPESLEALLVQVDQLRDNYYAEIKECDLLATDKGRKTIARNARKFASLKSRINEFKVEFVRKAKAEIKVIDDAGKKVRDHLDQCRDVVREPLTEWERERKEAQALIDQCFSDSISVDTTNIDDLKRVQSSTLQFQVHIGHLPEEFHDNAKEVASNALEKISHLIEVAEKAAYDAKELEKQRKENERLRIEKEHADAERIRTLEAENKKLQERPEVVPVVDITDMDFDEVLGNPIEYDIPDPVVGDHCKELEDAKMRISKLEQLVVDMYDFMPESTKYIDHSMRELGLLA